MLCDKCKKNQAKINLVKIVNGEKQETWLCEECAKNLSNMPFFSELGKDVGVPFQGLLTDILTNIEGAAKNKKPKELKCSQCGLTSSEFEKTGVLGCCNCYRTFSDAIKIKVDKLQGCSKHIGKVPKSSGENLSKKQKLNELKKKLQLCIMNEEYENAAVIRDEISDIEDMIRENMIKDIELELGEERCNEKLDS